MNFNETLNQTLVVQLVTFWSQPNSVQLINHRKHRIGQKTHPVKTGMNHIFLFSPNTCCRFLRKPTLNPFLSGPLTKTGAEKASGTEKYIAVGQNMLKYHNFTLLMLFFPP